MIVWEDGGGRDFCEELDINMEIKEFGGPDLGETGGSSVDECLSASDVGNFSHENIFGLEEKDYYEEGKLEQL